MEVVSVSKYKKYFLSTIFSQLFKLFKFKLDLTIRISRVCFVYDHEPVYVAVISQRLLLRMFSKWHNKKTDIWQNFVVFPLLNGFQWLEWHFKFA